METAAKIRKRLHEMARELGPAPTMLAKVAFVNLIDRTCTLIDDQTSLPYNDVRLRPVQDATKSITIIPKLNTWALAVRIEDTDEWMVIAVGEADKILIDCDEIVFNGGLNGGLVNWPDLKAEMEKTKELVDGLKSVLTGWTPVPNDGGAALKAYATAQLATKVTGVYTGLEDLTVKH